MRGYAAWERKEGEHTHSMCLVKYAVEVLNQLDPAALQRNPQLVEHISRLAAASMQTKEERLARTSARALLARLR